VKVDVIGVGAGVFDLLKREKEVEAIAVNVGETAPCETYVRVRDQIWYAVRDWLKDGGKFKSDSKLEAELVAPTFSFDARSRIKVESKDETKGKLLPVHSPDRADALCLAVYNPPVAFVGSSESDWMSR
jgi:hypothetical protein